MDSIRGCISGENRRILLKRARLLHLYYSIKVARERIGVRLVLHSINNVNQPKTWLFSLCSVLKIEQDLVARLKGLPGVNTQEMMMELILREDLFQADEAEAAKSLDTIERLIQNAGDQHQMLINTLAVRELA